MATRTRKTTGMIFNNTPYSILGEFHKLGNLEEVEGCFSCSLSPESFYAKERYEVWKKPGTLSQRRNFQYERESILFSLIYDL